jgi:hypothetical protein
MDHSVLLLKMQVRCIIRNIVRDWGEEVVSPLLQFLQFWQEYPCGSVALFMECLHLNDVTSNI